MAAIKKKADDLDAIQKSVSDAAAVGAPLWLSYIFLLFYIAIAAGAVTHKELLLESPVDLPFLNIKLPLKAFFVLAPILFLIVHAYVLAHFAMLSDKAKAFHDRLTAKVNAEVDNDHAIREGLRQQLPINVFVQFLAGPTDIRESAFGVMLWIIAWTTLVGAPVLVLLLLQLQFLPYHDTRVTWLHRVVLCADLGVIWWLWMKILAGRDRSKPKHLDRWMKGWDDFLWFFRRIGSQLATALVAIFSVVIATFPGEWDDWPFRLPQKLERRITTATEFVFGKVDALKSDEKERVTGNWPVNTLRLREFDIYAALGVEGPDKLDWKPYSFSLKHRRLEHADLRDARLDNIDLRGASLDGSLLDRAKLKKADLSEARLRGASLVLAQIQGASLLLAQLQGAKLNDARLQGASLSNAGLQGGSLSNARLQGASLDEAQLHGASLYKAQLQGALLYKARLQGASLYEAQLQGATLVWAQLQGAWLEGTYLWRTYWDELYAGSMKPIRFIQQKWKAVNYSFDGFFGYDEPWTANTYDELRKMIEKEVPQGAARDDTLRRIARLDCKKSGDDLAPCKANAAAVPKVREVIEGARTDEATYEQVLAMLLRPLICASEANAIQILRGLATNGRLTATGQEAPALIEDILTGKDCPVSTALTDADKERLQEIKAAALNKYPPALSPAAANERYASPVASPSAAPPKAPAKDNSRSSARVPAPP
ncbi:pentapeptide repeat-containing protein [Methylocystis sp. H62]|uniref:pentapeptide repeat-containing protein n=1 Tax=Methylocystis sp. H62 TaxID=2785789 RepID=UPI0018C2FAF2|nr:pentapeptide repeat-containing protein [Methylocystis sp. H62]MBG0794297.1 pentapeptide repeat-containing protein [Methylocystis sp. H62]